MQPDPATELTPIQALDLVIAKYGTQEAFAQRVSQVSGRRCTSQAVNKWRRKGYVPSDRCPCVVFLADGIDGVTERVLHPGIFNLAAANDPAPAEGQG